MNVKRSKRYLIPESKEEKKKVDHTLTLDSIKQTMEEIKKGARKFNLPPGSEKTVAILPLVYQDMPPVPTLREKERMLKYEAILKLMEVPNKALKERSEE